MPRQSRIDAPGALQHVVGRGIGRRKIFSDDADRDDFLNRLSRILSETQTACYAWALMPNHFHLLLRTGVMPISKVMSRLLTGYAAGYNRRHRRYGHLFQNRYKSILCQEEAYCMELIRYIHLNPLRAKLAKGYSGLSKYLYSGHSAVLGYHRNDWQDIDYVLGLFDKRVAVATRQYEKFVFGGVSAGRKPELVGGGLLRSQGGWTGVKALRDSGDYQKGDERILGDGNFVEQVLAQAREEKERRYRLRGEGFTFERVVKRVSELLDMDVDTVLDSTKRHRSVLARGILCFWATRELGITQTELASKLKMTQPAISKAVRRGEELAKQHQYRLTDQ